MPGSPSPGDDVKEETTDYAEYGRNKKISPGRP